MAVLIMANAYLNAVNANEVRQAVKRGRWQGAFLMAMLFAFGMAIAGYFDTQPTRITSTAQAQPTICKVEMQWGLAESHAYTGKIARQSIQ